MNGGKMAYVRYRQITFHYQHYVYIFYGNLSRGRRRREEGEEEKDSDVKNQRYLINFNVIADFL
jgi:hypothetical protein